MSALSLVEPTPLSPLAFRGCIEATPSVEPAPDPEPESESESARFAELAERLGDLSRDGNVEQALELGKLVLDTLYDGDLAAWRRRGSKAHSLRALARRSELAVSSSALYRSVALYELAQTHGGLERWAGLGISHLRLVLGLPVAEQRRLLDAALSRGWTVAELEREAVGVRKRGAATGTTRGGRPRLPRFVKSVNRLRKTAEAPDELFGDLAAAADMTPEQLAEIRDVLSTIRVRCDELDRALERYAE